MTLLYRSVLIVGDAPAGRATLRRYLERGPEASYIFYEAGSAAETLAMCRALRPDAIVLDGWLPDESGVALLEALFAQHGAALAVLVLSEAGDHIAAVAALKLGAQDYLVKTPQLEQRLGPALASALGAVDRRRQLALQQQELEARNRELEQALAIQRANAAQLNLTLQAARMAAWEWELATGAVRWGEGLATMAGLASNVFGGSFEAFWNVVHPDDRAAVRQAIDRALHDDAPYDIEFRMLRPDGSLRWAAARGTVVRDEHGRPIRMVGLDRDVTARKLAEEALRESEERYRALVTATSHIVWRASATGEMIAASPAWHDLTGQSEAELRGWGWASTIHPEDRARALVLWNQALAHKTVYENEFRVRTRDGSYRRFHGRGVPILAADGSVREWIGASRDITDQRRAEDDLRRREAEYKTLVEHAPDIIARFDRHQRHLYVSPQIEHVTGLPAAAFLGKTNQELGMPDHSCALWDAQLRQVFDSGSPAEFEFTFLAENQLRHYQAMIIPELSEHGQVMTVITIARDITAYKQAEERLRFLSEANTALAASLDYEATLRHVAQLAIPYLGDACIIDLIDEQWGDRTAIVAHVDKQLELTLHEMRSQYPPAWNSAHPVAQVLRTGQSIALAEIPQSTIQEHSHSTRHRELIQSLAPRSFVMVPLVLRGRNIGVISLYSTHGLRSYNQEDIALAEELARRTALALDNVRLYQEAQEAIREREAFLSVASHELKNPLTTLVGRAQLLKRRLGRRADVSHELSDLNIVIDQAQRINTLLSDLLDASRLTGDQFPVEHAALDLYPLLLDVVAALQASTSAHTIAVSGSGSALPIAGDASRLEQVFDNLISNAIKYSPAGGTIAIGVETYGDRARIAIRDEGLGIPADALPHLFKRFYRVTRDSATQISGSGIGLYVVKEIVSRHGGTIHVRSSEGAGSTFTVELPLLVPTRA